MSCKSDPRTEGSRSLQRINKSDGKKWRPSGSASKISLRRAQSSRILYFFSSSSSKSSNGVHSKITKPGDPSSALTVEAAGAIWKILSDSQVPEEGTSNLRWSQIAVPSLSWLIDSQTNQLEGRRSLSSRSRRELVNVPVAHLRSFSSWFCDARK